MNINTISSQDVFLLEIHAEGTLESLDPIIVQGLKVTPQSEKSDNTAWICSWFDKLADKMEMIEIDFAPNVENRDFTINLGDGITLDFKYLTLEIYQRSQYHLRGLKDISSDIDLQESIKNISAYI